MKLLSPNVSSPVLGSPLPTAVSYRQDVDAVREGISPEEYIAAERLAEAKHEFFGGRVFAIAGVSYAHSVLCSNFDRLLNSQLQGRSCHAVVADFRSE